MSSHTLPRSFTVERSDSPASSYGRASMKKPRPILRDLRNTLALQTTEGSRDSIKQGVPFDTSFSVTESPSSPERRRHHRGNDKYRVSPIALPATPRTVPSLNIPGYTLVDALACHVSNRDTPAKEEIILSHKHSSSMIVSDSDHGSLNIDNNSFFLESKHAVIHHCTKPFNPWKAPLNRRVVDQNALVFTIPPCSPTFPLSPPTASSSPMSDLLSKRSGRMFRLVPAQNDHFVHVVATDLTDYLIESPLESHCLSSPTHIGFPPDMLALLQELDELASWVQDFPYPEEALGALDILTIGSTVAVSCPHALRRLSNDQGDRFLQQPVLPDKGKSRMLTEPTDDISECQFHSAIPPASTPVTRRSSVRYIYEPQGTPSFLVGSSTSPIAYPAEGYRSPPREVIVPGPSSITSLNASTPVIRACGRRSVPNVSPPLLVSPPTGLTSFKAFFKRSRSNTMSIPQSNTCGREKKKFGWLKI